MSIEASALIGSEVGIMIERFFAGEPAGGIFRSFLKHKQGRLAALRTEEDNGGPTMYLEVTTRNGFTRQVRLRRHGAGETGIIEADTEVAYNGSAIVMQMILLLASGRDFLRYRLRPLDEFRLELFAEGRVGALLDEEDFHDLIFHLADTAERLEAII